MSQGTQAFGSLYEIRAENDEIFISDATVDDLEIIDAITASDFPSVLEMLLQLQLQIDLVYKAQVRIQALQQPQQQQRQQLLQQVQLPSSGSSGSVDLVPSGGGGSPAAAEDIVTNGSQDEQGIPARDDEVNRRPVDFPLGILDRSKQKVSQVAL